MSADLAAALHGPRLPEAFARLSAVDLLAAFGLGLMISALILWLFAPLLIRRPRRASLRQRLAWMASLPTEQRMLALARLAAERGVTLPEEQRQALYSGRGADPGALERAISRKGRAG